MSTVVETSAKHPNASIAVKVTSPELAVVPSATNNVALEDKGEGLDTMSKATGALVLFQEYAKPPLGLERASA